jgi:hypothetical protein
VVFIHESATVLLRAMGSEAICISTSHNARSWWETKEKECLEGRLYHFGPEHLHLFRKILGKLYSYTVQARDDYFVKSVTFPQGLCFGHGLSMTKAEFHKPMVREKISNGSHPYSKSKSFICAQILVICTEKYLYDFHFRSHGDITFHSHSIKNISSILGWSTKESPRSKWSVIQKMLRTPALKFSVSGWFVTSVLY